MNGVKSYYAYINKIITNKLNQFFIAIILIGFILPVIYPDPYLIHIIILGYIFGGLAASYDLLLGYAGILSFGPSALFGLGAYASALISIRLGYPPFISIFIGAIVSAFFGLFMTIPCLRLRLFAYVAITTWGIAEILRVIFAQWIGVTRGYLGLWGIPTFSTLNFLGKEIKFTKGSTGAYYLAYIILLLLLVFMYWIVNSKIGLQFRAVRDDDISAESIGIDVTRMKYLAFLLHGFTSGLLGAYYAHYIGILTPDVYSVNVSTQIIAYQLIGGEASLFGPVIGGLLMVFISEYLRIIGMFRLIILGLLIIIFILFLPEGLIGIFKKLKTHIM